MQLESLKQIRARYVQTSAWAKWVKPYHIVVEPYVGTFHCLLVRELCQMTSHCAGVISEVVGIPSDNTLVVLLDSAVPGQSPRLYLIKE